MIDKVGQIILQRLFFSPRDFYYYKLNINEKLKKNFPQRKRFQLHIKTLKDGKGCVDIGFLHFV